MAQEVESKAFAKHVGRGEQQPDTHESVAHTVSPDGSVTRKVIFTVTTYPLKDHKYETDVNISFDPHHPADCDEVAKLTQQEHTCVTVISDIAVSAMAKLNHIEMENADD